MSHSPGGHAGLPRTLLATVLVAAVAGLFVGTLSALSTPTTGLLAATIVGDSQGVPPRFTGQTYTDYIDCYVNSSANDYTSPYVPICDTHGNPGAGSPYAFYSGIFSIHPSGSPEAGHSQYTTIIWNGLGGFYSGLTDAGDTVSVQAGAPLLLEFSCLPSRTTINTWKSDQGLFSQGGWSTAIVYDLYPLATHVNLGGPGLSQSIDNTLNGTVAVTAPATPGTYTYTASCAGGVLSSDMSIPVTVIGAPTVSLAANGQPTITVSPGTTYTLSYASSNVSSCALSYTSAGGSGSDPVPPNVSGSSQTGLIGSFTLTCQSPIGPQSKTVTINSNAPPSSPSVSLVANGQTNLTILPNTAYTLSWASSGVKAPTCRIAYTPTSGTAGYFDVPANVSGSAQTGLIGQYVIGCLTPANQPISRTVTITQGVPAQCNGTNCSLTCNPASVLPGGKVTCSWMCSSAYATSQGSGFPTGGQLTGSYDVFPTQNTTYGLTCRTASNEPTSANASVLVNQPSLSITANPERVQRGKTSTISWTTANVSAGSCRITANAGSVAWSGDIGSREATIGVQTIFTLTCATPAGNVQRSTTVNLVPNVIEL